MIDQQIHDFLSGLVGQTANLRAVIDYCYERRKIANPTLRILATSLVEIFREIDDYLEYFETELEAKFGFASKAEKAKIQEIVLNPFIKYLSDQDNLGSME